jgi:hypothetical protein
MDVNTSGSSATKRRRPPSLLGLATVGFIVAWLAVASYAIDYLVSH